MSIKDKIEKLSSGIVLLKSYNEGAINDLENKLKEITQELQQQEIQKPKDFELYIAVSTNRKLVIGFKSGDIPYPIGFIYKNDDDEGECWFLTYTPQQENWETWKQQGFKVANQEPVEWQGLKWLITSRGRLKIYPENKIFGDVVYNFTEKSSARDITVDNDFLKKDSDNRIHLY